MDYEEITSQKQAGERVIDKILKQLTPENIQKQIKEIQEIELPLELQKWIQEYEKVGERDSFFWKWLYRAFQIVYLPIVPEEYLKILPQIKVLVTMHVTVLDDAADREKNKLLLGELLKTSQRKKYINFTQLNPKEKNKVEFAIKIWDHCKEIIHEFPGYEKFGEIFEYDIVQVLNAIKYSYIINTNPYLINKIECELYGPYNMVAMVYSTLDLMCSPGFSIQNLGKTREICWQAQKMARIGNWISTWERELGENDFTSGVFAHAIHSRILTVDDLKKEDKLETIKKIKNSKIEEKLLREWERYYNEIKEGSQKIEELGINKFLPKLEKFIILHLTARGYK